MDAGYINLLAHLQNDSISVSAENLAGSISYYLCRPPQHVPSPTSLVVAVMRSALWKPYTLSSCTSLRDAFTYAVVMKHEDIFKEDARIFSQRRGAKLDTWVQDVCGGTPGGSALLRLVVFVGLTKGIIETEKKTPSLRLRCRESIENDMISVLSGVLRTNSWDHSWTEELTGSDSSNDTQTLSLIVAAESLRAMSVTRLKRMDLNVLISTIVDLIIMPFSGSQESFLSGAQGCSAFDYEHRLTYLPTAPLHRKIDDILTQPVFLSISHLARLLAYSIDQYSRIHPDRALVTVTHVLDKLLSSTQYVADCWNLCPLASVESEDDIAPATRQLVTNIWTILKTQLFAVIMITQATLSTAVYPPSSSLWHFTRTTMDPLVVSLQVLRTLRTLSFVIAQFGGIAPSSGSGFTELKRVVYAALDILSSDDGCSTQFIRNSVSDAQQADTHPPTVKRSRLAFTLACVEQLIPSLSEVTIMEDVLPLSIPFLNNIEHRNIYESAHSVILAILDTSTSTRNASHLASSGVARRIIPFYLKCLLDNSGADGLNDEQLRLAFTTLLRSAHKCTEVPGPDVVPAEALAWFCLDSTHSELRVAIEAGDASRAQRLRRAFVAGVSGLPLTLTVRALEVLADIINKLPAHGHDRKDLLDLIRDEMLRNSSDMQKDTVIAWWHNNRLIWTTDGTDAQVTEAVQPALL